MRDYISSFYVTAYMAFVILASATLSHMIINFLPFRPLFVPPMKNIRKEALLEEAFASSCLILAMPLVRSVNKPV
jgi:hypothetical protein